MASVVFITGCSAGSIGAALAEEFNRKGYKVYAAARRLEAMSGLPKDVQRVILDVTSKEACEKAIAAVIKAEGSVDVLVNSAGIQAVQSLMDAPIESLQAHLETNVVGGVRLTKLVVPHMAQKGRGLIINMGSVLGYASYPLIAPYCASKFALRAVNDCLRLELNPLGIDVMLVAPGFVKTPMVGGPKSSKAAGAKPASGACAPSSSGYGAWSKDVDAIYDFINRFAGGPEGLARAVVAASESKWGPPAHMTWGLCSWACWLTGFLPPFIKDWVAGGPAGWLPRSRAAGKMQGYLQQQAAAAAEE